MRGAAQERVVAGDVQLGVAGHAGSLAVCRVRAQNKNEKQVGIAPG
jgi:hypothetical protein